MKIETRNESDVTIIKPVGRMDFNALSEFQSILNTKIQGGAKKILLDFSQLEYLSSAGIRALMDGMKQLEPNGGKLTFCSLNSQILELFEVVQLKKVFKIYNSEFEALDELIS